MLIVLRMRPIATPGKSILCKKLIAQIIMIDFVWKILATVYICRSIGWFNGQFSVYRLHIRIVQRIDIHSHTQTMF